MEILLEWTWHRGPAISGKQKYLHAGLYEATHKKNSKNIMMEHLSGAGMQLEKHWINSKEVASAINVKLEQFTLVGTWTSSFIKTKFNGSERYVACEKRDTNQSFGSWSSPGASLLKLYSWISGIQYFFITKHETGSNFACWGSTQYNWQRYSRTVCWPANPREWCTSLKVTIYGLGLLLCTPAAIDKQRKI